MKAAAAVLRDFGKPLDITEIEVVPLEPGEVLVKVLEAGVCGSDVHIWRGNDPRVPLPIIPGHETVGEVLETAGAVCDLHGRPLEPGDVVAWERSITCGRCWYCAVTKEPWLCETRRVYGINYPASERPYLVGGYARMVHLLAGMSFIKLDDRIDRRIAAAAVCSGATAAHSIELARIRPGDAAVVIGPGPLGLFVTAFAAASGAGAVIVLGTKADAERLRLARELGSTDTLEVDSTEAHDRRERILDATGGIGAEVVFECAGRVDAAAEGLKLVAKGGKLLVVGIATPVGDWPVSVYEDVSRRNVAIQGARHLVQALALTRKVPALSKLVTHSFALEDATRALEATGAHEIIKGVIEPTRWPRPA